MTEVNWGLYLLQVHLVSFPFEKTYTGICSQLAKLINSVVVPHDPCFSIAHSVSEAVVQRLLLSLKNELHSAL